jgi:hypothetical protein
MKGNAVAPRRWARLASAAAWGSSGFFASSASACSHLYRRRAGQSEELRADHVVQRSVADRVEPRSGAGPIGGGEIVQPPRDSAALLRRQLRRHQCGARVAGLDAGIRRCGGGRR